MTKLLFGLFLAIPLCAQSNAVIGPGGTTAYYIDRDADGCGVGVKTSGTYPLGIQHGVVPDSATGDKLDADDRDPLVCTTAQWRTKWAATGGSTDAASIQVWLMARYGWSNSVNRVAFISLDGNDATGVVDDADHPFASAFGLRTIFGDGLGGVVVVRGGVYSTLGFYAGGSLTWPLTGTAGHPLYIMTYPGERVLVHHGLIGANDGYSAPVPKGMYYVTFDGFQWTDGNYDDAPGGSDDGLDVMDGHFITLRNCEVVGFDKIFFGNHCEHITIEWSVFHEESAHAIYFGCSGNPVGVGDADFDYAANWAAWSQLVDNAGSSRNVTIQHNVLYNNGSWGYDPIHINTWVRDLLIDSNIISHSGGSSIVLARGVAYATVSNNLIWDGAAAAWTIDSSLADPPLAPGAYASSQHDITYVNNTIWTGSSSESINGQQVFFPMQINAWTRVYNVSLINNILVGSHMAGWSILAARHDSAPDNWTVKNNLFWYADGVTNPATECVMTIEDTAYANGANAGCYTLAQMEAFTSAQGSSGNKIANPLFVAQAATGWTEHPEYFNLKVQAGSPAIGAGIASGITSDLLGLRRATMDIGAYAYAGVTPIAPTISTTSLPTAIYGASYRAALSITGDLPMTITVLSGLPSWASMDSSGVVTGSSPLPGSSTIQVLASNSAGNAVQTVTLNGIVTAVINGLRMSGGGSVH